MGVSHNKKRDLSFVFGYPDESELTYEFYDEWWRRSGFANVLISKPARSCWRDGAKIKNDEDDGKELLVDEMKVLTRAGFFGAIERADIENRKGHFSVLYVGIPGDGDPKEPITRRSRKNMLKDVYFTVFSESAVSISEYDDDPTSKNFGGPLIYTLTPSSSYATETSRVKEIQESMEVHRDRIIHLAEGATTSNFVGLPFLEPVVNRLVDLNKTMGGSAEAFFRAGDPKRTIDVDPDATISDEDWEAFQTKAEEWVNDWKTFIGLRGAKVRNLVDQISSPKDAVMVSILEIAAYSGWSLRQFTGEGGGQYTGQEDKATYNQIIADRQNQFCSPLVIRLHEILSEAGFYEFPDDAVVSWPISDALDEKSKAEAKKNEAAAAASITAALTNYVMSGVDSLLGFKDFLIEVVGLDQARAEELAKKAEEIQAKLPEIDPLEEDELDVTQDGQGDEDNPNNPNNLDDQGSQGNQDSQGDA